MAILTRLQLTGAAAAGIVLALPALPASAGQEAHGRFGVEITDQHVVTTEEDFCGVDGLTVTTDYSAHGQGFFTYRGAASIPYFTGTFHSVFTVTEPDGTTVTITSNTMSKDQHIVDNGDGTFTITGIAAGGFKVIGPDRTLRDPGMIIFKVLVDTNGTPQDPFDDEVLVDYGPIRDSTGLNETGPSFCSDYLELTGRSA